MKNKNYSLFAFTLISGSLFSLMLASTLSSATVELKNGKILEGALSSANESVIVLKYNFGEIEFPVKRISNIKDLNSNEIEILNSSNFITKNTHLVKNIALPKADSELPDKSYEFTQKAAVDAVQSLKDKINDKCSREKEDLHNSYTNQISFFEEQISSLTDKLANLEKHKHSMEQEIAALERSKETSLDEITAKKNRILSLQQEINSLKGNILEKEKESAEKIRSVISENERLYQEEITSLKDSYLSEIELLKKEASSLRKRSIEKDKAANQSLMSAIEKLESQHSAEKQALESHYQAQIEAFKGEQTALIKRYTLQIDEMKKDMNALRTDLVTAQAETDLRMAETLKAKEEHFAQAKMALTNKMSAQIEILQTEISNISEQNDNLLKKDNQRQAHLLKIQSEEKSKIDKIAGLEKEIAALRTEKENQALAYINGFDKEKTSLKTMISSSSEKLVRLSQEKKELMENISLLTEEVETFKNSNEMLQGKLGLAEKEKSIILQEKDILAKKIDATDKIRNAEKEEIVAGIVSEALKTEVEQTGPVSEKELALSENAKASREALIELYKEDLMKLQQRIEEKNLEIKNLANESFSLKDDLDLTKKEKMSAIDELKNYKERYTQLEKEKMEIKNNADLIIQQVQQQAQANVNQEKENLREAYNEVIANIEARLTEQKEQESAVLQGIPVTRSFTDTTETEITEIPLVNDSAEEIKEPSSNVTAEIPSKLVQAGTVSDVGTDYGRIYIETLSNVNKGDTLWIKKDDGKSYQFKVIQVLPALNGAIAEINILDHISDINKNDPVFSLE